MGEIKTNEMINLEPNQCWTMLRSCAVGRIAMSTADHPDIFPVNFVVDHGSVVFRTAEGTKLAEAALGRLVAFEVDGYNAGSDEAWSVVVKGSARGIEGMHELFDVAERPLFPWHASSKHCYVRIDPVQVTGKCFGVIDPNRSRPGRTAVVREQVSERVGRNPGDDLLKAATWFRGVAKPR